MNDKEVFNTEIHTGELILYLKPDGYVMTQCHRFLFGFVTGMIVAGVFIVLGSLK
jgi:hypothetical protein